MTTARVRYDDLVLVRGEIHQFPEKLLEALGERGFHVVLCCGTNREQMIGVYHPARVKPDTTITCPRCKTVLTWHVDKADFLLPTGETVRQMHEITIEQIASELPE